MKSGILNFLGLTSSKWLKLDANKAITSGDPGISDVTGLTDALAGKADLAHASRHNAGGADALAIDAAAATGSLRTLGTSATSACAGNDGRLSDARTPTAHASSHNAGGADALAIDSAAATGSLRTLGTGAQQAAAGNHTHAGLITSQAWIWWDSGTPTLGNGSNVSSLDDDGTGEVGINFTSGYAAATFQALATVGDASGTIIATEKARATGSVDFACRTNAGLAADPDIGLSVIVLRA